MWELILETISFIYYLWVLKFMFNFLSKLLKLYILLKKGLLIYLQKYRISTEVLQYKKCLQAAY